MGTTREIHSHCCICGQLPGYGTLLLLRSEGPLPTEDYVHNLCYWSSVNALMPDETRGRWPRRELLDGPVPLVRLDVQQ